MSFCCAYVGLVIYSNKPQELVRYTAPEHNAYGQLQKAMSDIKEIVEFANERKRSVENLTKISEIKETVSNVPDVRFRINTGLTHRYFFTTSIDRLLMRKISKRRAKRTSPRSDA